MNDHPSHAVPAPSAEDPESGELHRRFGDRWQIEQPALGVWSATHRSAGGRHIRVIIGPSAAELMGKLAAAEVCEP